MTEATIIKEKYVVTATKDCTVTATRNGKTYTLLTLKAGQQGAFQAISDSVTISDNNAVMFPFSEASACIIGSAGGGLSEEELVNYGVLEKWTTEDVTTVKLLGSNSGFGSQKPTFKPLNGVPFTYTLTDGATAKFNRIEICVKTEEVPTLVVGGRRCAYLSHRIVDDYLYITYNTYDAYNPDVMLNYNSIEIVIVGAISVGGGQVDNPSVNGYTLSSNVDYYPYAKLYLVGKTDHVGVETEVYNVTKIDNATNKILPFSDATTPTMNSLLENLIQYEPSVNVVLNTGKLSTSGEDVITSATLYIRNNAVAQSDLVTMFNQYIGIDSQNTATARIHRLH